MVFSKVAVHSALWLVLTMLCLGCMYIAQEAEFLGFVQIIVYTGAIMMLFLFVLMLTGRDAGDSRGRGAARPAGRCDPGRHRRRRAAGHRSAAGAVQATSPVGLEPAMADRGADRLHRRGDLHRLPVPVRADQRAADHGRDRRDGPGARRGAARRAPQPAAAGHRADAVGPDVAAARTRGVRHLVVQRHPGAAARREHRTGIGVRAGAGLRVASGWPGSTRTATR